MIKDLTQGTPLKLILIFSIPLLIGNIFQQLYNIADLIIVGRLLGVEAFASVGATAPLFFLITFIIVGLTNGFAVITGQRYGAKNYDGVKNSVVISTILSFGVSLLFTIFCTLLMHPVLHMLNVPENIYHNAYWYTEIIVLGLVCSLIAFIFFGFVLRLVVFFEFGKIALSFALWQLFYFFEGRSDRIAVA